MPSGRESDLGYWNSGLAFVGGRFWNCRYIHASTSEGYRPGMGPQRLIQRLIAKDWRCTSYADIATVRGEIGSYHEVGTRP